MTTVIVSAALLVLYTYAVYPAILWLAAAVRPRRRTHAAPLELPRLSITVPAYNEARTIGATLDRILELDYPADRRQILVVSDASTDGTDAVVEGYRNRGVELLRVPVRGGKTAAENAARPHLTGDIVVNTDASVRIRQDALKPLVAAFEDPEVGVASGRDVSVARVDDSANLGESGYVGYEMWVRGLETRVSGIVGASGCFYAIRKALHMELVPEALSRDFAAALVARERGYRAVSVDEAVCFVPRTFSIEAEYKRKVRTIARGMETLYYKRHLLNPLRDGVFSWMLVSHKICRWLLPWAGVLALLALIPLARESWLARGALAVTAVTGALAFLGWRRAEGRPMPRYFSLPAFLVAGNVAALHATIKAFRRELNPVWEPTRRRAVDT